MGGSRRPRPPPGYAQIMAALAGLPELAKRKVLKKIVRDGANRLLMATKLEAMKQGIHRTGDYVDGLRMKVATKKGDDELRAGVVNVGRNRSLWHLLEFGYRYFVSPKSQFKLPADAQHGQVAARPHLRPALDTSSDKIRGDAHRVLEKLIAKELRRQMRAKRGR